MSKTLNFGFTTKHLRLKCFKTKGELEEFIYHDNHITTKRIKEKSKNDLRKNKSYFYLSLCIL